MREELTGQQLGRGKLSRLLPSWNIHFASLQPQRSYWSLKAQPEWASVVAMPHRQPYSNRQWRLPEGPPSPARRSTQATLRLNPDTDVLCS